MEFTVKTFYRIGFYCYAGFSAIALINIFTTVWCGEGFLKIMGSILQFVFNFACFLLFNYLLTSQQDTPTINKDDYEKELKEVEKYLNANTNNRPKTRRKN